MRLTDRNPAALAARAIRNHLRFVLGDGSHDVDRQTIRLREIHGLKFDLRFHQV